jgi:hypothetical protein
MTQTGSGRRSLPEGSDGCGASEFMERPRVTQHEKDEPTHQQIFKVRSLQTTLGKRPAPSEGAGQGYRL